MSRIPNNVYISCVGMSKQSKAKDRVMRHVFIFVLDERVQHMPVPIEPRTSRSSRLNVNIAFFSTGRCLRRFKDSRPHTIE